MFVLPANSPLKTMKDVVEQMKKDPGSVKWGGGSRGSTEHIAAAMLAREAGVDPAKINYVAFRGGGEALGRHPGRQRHRRRQRLQRVRASTSRPARCGPIAVTSDKRLPGIDVPTLKEQGIDVVIGNWRGVYGAPGITPEQRKALTDMVRQGDQDQGLAARRSRRTTGRRR